jgi:molybdopterin-guanine dinucleotide biosynthesis protein MobB
MATPLLSIVGKSNSGKTTLIEKLLKELVPRGYRIATIKHHAHDVDLDTPGKDSFRHREAGAAAVVLTSSHFLFVTETLDRNLPLSEIRDKYLEDGYDLILTEGFKQDTAPKIEVLRAARSTALICNPGDPSLIAVVTDLPLDLASPCFGLDDIREIADFIEARFLK